MKRILDKDFKYTSAAATDIRKTFARVRREQAKAVKEESREPRFFITWIGSGGGSGNSGGSGGDRYGPFCGHEGRQYKTKGAK
jgi:hypothetical protein